MTNGLLMLQGSATDFSDGVGLAKIDSHIAILHRRLDRIAKIASRDDVDFRIVHPQDRLMVFPMRPAAPMSNTRTARHFILAETLTPGKGEATRVSSQDSHVELDYAARRKRRRRCGVSFTSLKFLERPAQARLICFAHLA